MSAYILFWERTDKMPLSDNIRRNRERMGYSQTELAKLCGLDQSAICRFERGTAVPTVATLDTLAARLNVSIDALVRGETEKTA